MPQVTHLAATQHVPLRKMAGVLGSTPGNCRPFHFPLFSPHDV